MEDELRDRQSRIEDQRHLTLINNLQRDAAPEARINLCGCGDHESHSSPSRLADHIAHQARRNLNEFQCAADHQLVGMENELSAQGLDDALLMTRHVWAIRSSNI